jgi:FkbM family methyltransferase
MSELRRLASGVKRRLTPSPEERARRALEQEAAHQARYQSGSIRLLDMQIDYADAGSTVPQWDDLFVRRSLRFTPASDAPRILDCGANIGLATLWLKRAYPAARITAFEADPGITALLTRNLRRNGAADVEVVAAAVWSSTGVLRFRSEGSDSGAVDAVGADTPGAGIEIASVRLRDWLEAGTVDFVKMDIEGAELEVLRDCAGALSQVRALQIEVHDFDVADRRLPACLDLLGRAGFDYTLDDLHQASWRDGAAAAGPFPGVAAWVILVRAWQRTRP